MLNEKIIRSLKPPRVGRLEVNPAAVGTHDMLRLYVRKHVEQRLKNHDQVAKIFETHVFPYLPENPKRADITILLDKLEEQGMHAQVNRVRAQLLKAFSWGMERDYVSFNPFLAERSSRQSLDLERPTPHRSPPHA